MNCFHGDKIYHRFILENTLIRVFFVRNFASFSLKPYFENPFNQIKFLHGKTRSQ